MSHDSSNRDRRPGFEPWPWMLGGLLAAMIVISISFFAVASLHPDADVRAEQGAERAAASTEPPEARVDQVGTQ